MIDSTQPTPPRPVNQLPSLRWRWRLYLIIGLNLLAALLAAFASAVIWLVKTEDAPGPSLPLGVWIGMVWALSLGLALVIGETLVRRILRTVLKPLDMLSRGAQAVSAGDYRYRVRLPQNSAREIADLGRAFNRMVMRLQETQAQIDAYTYQVEEIVDLRAREISRKALQLEVAAQVSAKIATILDPRALLPEVVELIRERFNIYHADVLLLDADGTQLVSNCQGCGPGDPVTIPLRDDSASVIAWAAQQGQTVYVPDVHQEPRYRPSPDLPASQSELVIPLQFGGRAIGVLNLEADHRDAFAKDEIAVLESLANEIAVSIHNAQMFSALETANRDLAQATLQARQASLLKSRFLLNASHKLRTPLNAIIGYSETMLSGIYGELSSTALDRQRRILDNGRHLQALIEDMLDLSSIESGEMALDLDWIELPPLLEEIMNAARALHQAAYAEHALTLRLDLPPGLPPAWVDVDRLRYILMNLLSNAIKFTPAGEIILAAETTPDLLLLHVRDTGPGIAEDELAYLFEPFQQEQGSTASGGKGTGLGLPVSRLLALMHGGDLGVASILGKGSTFTLKLPRCPLSAPPPPQE